MFDHIKEDVNAAFQNDPRQEASWKYFVLSWRACPVPAPDGLLSVEERLETSLRVISHLNRFLSGIEIHPAAEIGRGVFIDHGMGVVIGETAVVGDGCLIYKGVVLGGTTTEKVKRHPTLGKKSPLGQTPVSLAT